MNKIFPNEKFFTGTSNINIIYVNDNNHTIAVI